MTSLVASPSGSTTEGSSEPIYQVKLLAALRNGDPALICSLLTEISGDRKAADGGFDLGAGAIHLAVRCASYNTIHLLLQNRSILPNAVHPPGSKTTALHLAASLGRTDVVTLLLDQEGIDDTLRDSKGLTAKEVARTKEVRDVIQDSQSVFRASFISLLRTYVLSPVTAPPPPGLLAHLMSPRVSLLDLSYLDDSSGTTLLHEAARRKDLRLVELAVRAGADVFVRDRRGRPVADAAGKDDRVKVFLRQFTNQDKTLMDAPMTEPPVLKGYLNKYANVARGYNTRWFVLKDGVLSYYRHQDDENLTCRGSISMRSALLKVAAGNEKLRFEVQSIPHNRFVPGHGHVPHSSHSSGVQKWYMKANHPAEVARWTRAIKASIEWYQADSGLGDDQVSKSGNVSDASSLRTRQKNEKPLRQDSAQGSVASSVGHEVGESEIIIPQVHGDAHPEYTPSVGKSSASGSITSPPHADTFELQSQTAVAQLELTSKLLTSFTLPTSSTPQLLRVEGTFKESFAQLESVVNDLVRMTKEREEWYQEKLKKERDYASAWEASLSVVVREGEALEQELRKRGRGKLKRRGTLDPVDSGSPTIRQKPPRNLPSLDVAATTGPTTTAPVVASPDLMTPTVDRPGRVFPMTIVTTSPPPAPQVPLSPEPDGVDTDEEDEFFDAIETNNLPNLTVSDTLKSSSLPVSLRSLSVSMDPYQGYAHLRDELPIKSDDRPSTSLWQVLKTSIGKDLTKITFPVYFNEPTSMLQRMAEDMEFSECLDAAVAETDPHKRIAFVAAFAMSNYSSTIGRIAKPFNPMLGETFEYVRLDKRYRYYSEQVSHHPPISACYADASDWRYYGEVDAQNKFMGKSFEIRPTGVAHAELKILNETGTNARTGGRYEHYTWKKVATNVSGFLLGSTTIDHYGDMTIINHRTNDSCVLTFKPRGWRGKDAFEISGYVLDASGNKTYEIAGRWNSQLVARKAGDGHSAPFDFNIRSPTSLSAPEYILLWRNTPKPQAPFNLTPFAITLNDCPDTTLKPYLPPTDCRLRPDQRAFEIGRYDRANELKSMQEDHQRATRRKREDGQLPEHKPKWFEAKTDGDTGERVWSPLRNGDKLQYWIEREKAFRSQGKDAWPGVDSIFIDATP